MDQFEPKFLDNVESLCEELFECVDSTGSYTQQSLLEQFDTLMAKWNDGFPDVKDVTDICFEITAAHAYRNALEGYQEAMAREIDGCEHGPERGVMPVEGMDHSHGQFKNQWLGYFDSKQSGLVVDRDERTKLETAIENHYKILRKSNGECIKRIRAERIAAVKGDDDSWSCLIL